MKNDDRHVPDLPGTVTAITTQKKNKQRYSVFVDEAFLIGVADDTLLDYDLKKGSEITVPLFRKLQRAEGRHAVKSYLLKLLSRRDHARKELFDKARRKDHPGDIINAVIDELEAKDLIHEQKFAASFARDKCKLNRWGPYKIKAHLRKKGIAKQTAEDAVQAVYETVDLGERFQELIQKRRRHFLREEDPFKRKKKVFDYLRRKGYRSGSIYHHLDELTDMISDEESDT